MSTIFSRKNVDAICRAVVQQYNALHDTLTLTDGYGSTAYHRDISGVPSGDFSAPSSTALQVTAAAASSLSTSITLANNIYNVLAVHFVDDSAHLKADSTAKSSLDGYAVLASTAAAGDVVTLVNAMKTIYVAHCSASGVHVINDTVNTWPGAAATDLTSAEALLNTGKSTVNDHINSGPVVGRIKLLDG